jgi:hypothetical protein
MEREEGLGKRRGGKSLKRAKRLRFIFVNDDENMV